MRLKKSNVVGLHDECHSLEITIPLVWRFGGSVNHPPMGPMSINRGDSDLVEKIKTKSLVEPKG